MEFIDGIELYQYLCHAGRMEERKAKFLFKHILKGLLALHNKGVVHRDIKLANILVRKNNGLPVIIDLGFAAAISGDSPGGYFEKSFCGSYNYMAPELHQCIPYKGTEVDFFALGICLFTLVVGNPPFNTAQDDNKLYRSIAANRTELFWTFHLKSRPTGVNDLS